jgi:hypothetical protein
MTAGIGCNAASCPTQGFTLTNTGNVTLTTIGSGTLGGADATQLSIVGTLSSCGTTYTSLAPGNSCVVTVRFQPTGTPGGRTATLAVTSAAPTQTSTINATAQ